ncbi:hypothetical protein F7F49_09610 [Escherichia coli]|uniref:hypothetical protein n=1 Tax=Escherichia coli TaxID=562 RepID=UPI0002514501|nr:hypothetical protein [Escherichia coli]AWJ46845.1 hypothetical protein I3O_13615 [Escherichia coli O111 str. RM9322]EFP9267266.1 hypothetical protein [Shigella flexneri]EHW16516.1 hypothetical protein ECDEC8C_3393 [Escherichia coli DEC8C]EIH79758.1 hypothetical protein EC40522_2370 [Escherichia coli 4.0522]KDY51259.1 hypothetical protein AB91_3746 [Escherichia coli 2-460-02_S3_C1]KDY59387.1 hypothetical protein AC20_3316 [Escherichia coli 2-460-02_S3_C2]QCH77865.1 hypothetical protein CCU
MEADETSGTRNQVFHVYPSFRPNSSQAPTGAIKSGMIPLDGKKANCYIFLRLPFLLVRR